MAHIHLSCLLTLAFLHAVSVSLVTTQLDSFSLTEGLNVSGDSSPLSLFQVFSSGVFELKIHSFHTAQRICRRHRDCHIFFRICLKHPEDVISAEPPCTFGTGHTNVIRADHTSISSSAPIKVPFHFKWPVNEIAFI